MACLIVPAVEAVVTTVITRQVKRREQQQFASATRSEQVRLSEKIPFSRKLGWLNKLLWGGSALLAFEHVWHGEIVPFFPFLTAMSDPAATAEMLHEMATVGVSMAVLVTLVWGGMVAVSAAMEKRDSRQSEQA